MFSILLEDITDAFNELVVEEETGVLLCELCFAEKESLGNKTPGQFKFDTDETGNNDAKQSRSFLNLK